jgi:hypothetical protein
VTEPGSVAHAIWWQVYLLGFVGAFRRLPPTADEHRRRLDRDWLDHAIELARPVSRWPVWRTHGDTTDHYRTDRARRRRLGLHLTPRPTSGLRVLLEACSRMAPTSPLS